MGLLTVLAIFHNQRLLIVAGAPKRPFRVREYFRTPKAHESAGLFVG
jgi:hypothetical protein